jgi:hypothetical protein
VFVISTKQHDIATQYFFLYATIIAGQAVLLGGWRGVPPCGFRMKTAATNGRARGGEMCGFNVI